MSKKIVVLLRFYDILYVKAFILADGAIQHVRKECTMIKNTKNILIVSGGMVDCKWAAKWLENRHFDYVIAADRGLMYADELNISVDKILGDYDSIQPEILEKYRDSGKKIITFPREKDYTDTHLAIETAIEEGASEITIMGATGTRLDHTMANIQNMLIPLKADVKCCIINEFNKIYLSNKRTVIRRDKQHGKYISLVPMSETVKGITLTGFYYPLDKYTIEQGLSVGISNEIIHEEGIIELEEGILIVFETND